MTAATSAAPKREVSPLAGEALHAPVFRGIGGTASPAAVLSVPPAPAGDEELPP